MEIKQIQLNKVRIDPLRPPTDNQMVLALSDSMRILGQISPIIVYPVFFSTMGKADNDGFCVLCGNHRYEAAKLLGWEEISAIVVDPKDRQRHHLVEISDNLNNSRLSARERHRLMRELKEKTTPTCQYKPAPVLVEDKQECRVSSSPRKVDVVSIASAVKDRRQRDGDGFNRSELYRELLDSGVTVHAQARGFVTFCLKLMKDGEAGPVFRSDR